eukprot:TRINITY_DN1385_c2_g1_i2.p1 TRINITY_DN1385_c2_g1~~TRINITY_DN1385_c2_g1_i2.p1  ORF type:complete len:261 (+),score=62.59 TRINITY_DN1385_c2_g1_i2:161-943(+)
MHPIRAEPHVPGMEDDDFGLHAPRAPGRLRGGLAPAPDVVFIGRIPRQATQAQMRSFLEKRFGPIRRVRFVFDPQTKHHRGFGFVKFHDVACARRALSEGSRDGLRFCGALLRLGEPVDTRAQAGWQTPPPTTARALPADYTAAGPAATPARVAAAAATAAPASPAAAALAASTLAGTPVIRLPPPVPAADPVMCWPPAASQPLLQVAAPLPVVQTAPTVEQVSMPMCVVPIAMSAVPPAVVPQVVMAVPAQNVVRMQQQ